MTSIGESGPLACLCQHCHETGVVTPARQKLVVEGGTFCECSAGSARWSAALELMQQAERDLGSCVPRPRQGDRSLGSLREPWSAR